MGDIDSSSANNNAKANVVRQIVLDTETTGLDPKSGHRIIEIGCVELVNRRLTGRTFHVYLNPEREVDPEAIKVHGLTDKFLADKPRFSDVVQEFLIFIDGAELVIHNAPFDVGFLNAELKWFGNAWENLESHCKVFDTLTHARNLHPGQKNNLDALCKRYDVNNTERTFHGALLDAKILADVYLAMTKEQFGLSFASGEGNENGEEGQSNGAAATISVQNSRTVAGELPVIRASDEESAAHEAILAKFKSSNGEDPLWVKLLN